MPEITHMLMWAMSDRAIPRSYRMMQGFGVHSYRLVNDAGESVFVKFHWSPVAGTHSLVWDEAVKISGADPDFHRRDLWEAIEAGAYPEWELGLQIFTEAQAEGFSFDILDATKIVPEELVPLMPVGRLVLNRNPDNFFAETEQVAFCTAHVVPGIDFSNDPLLAGRIHSYVDTDLAAGRAEFTRSRLTPRSRRCTTTSATACIVKRSTAAGSHAAELAGWRMSLSSRRCGIRLVCRQDRARSQQAARQARAICGALRAGTPVPRQVKRQQSAPTSSTRSASAHSRTAPPFASGWCQA